MGAFTERGVIHLEYNLSEIMFDYQNYEILLQILTIKLNEIDVGEIMNSSNYKHKYFPDEYCELTKEEKLSAIQRLKKKKAALEKQKKLMDLALVTLDERELKLVELIYFNKLTHKDAAEKLNVSPRYIEDLKRNVIKKITTVLDGGYIKID